jgi:hypothetical protein
MKRPPDRGARPCRNSSKRERRGSSSPPSAGRRQSLHASYQPHLIHRASYRGHQSRGKAGAVEKAAIMEKAPVPEEDVAVTDEEPPITNKAAIVGEDAAVPDEEPPIMGKTAAAPARAAPTPATPTPAGGDPGRRIVGRRVCITPIGIVGARRYGRPGMPTPTPTNAASDRFVGRAEAESPAIATATTTARRNQSFATSRDMKTLRMWTGVPRA